MVNEADDQLPAADLSAAPPVEEVDARLGSILDTWRLDALIGRGEISRVYLGTDRKAGQAAIKIMNVELARDRRLRWRFFRDANVSERLDHVGVVRVLRKDVTREGEPFTVMELLRGASLERLAADAGGSLGADIVAYVGVQVADLLTHAHERQILHRNLSPASFFVTTTGRVKTLGFAASWTADELADQPPPDAIVGPSPWRAPELDGEAREHGDARADVYGLAAALYSLATGQPPRQMTADGWHRTADLGALAHAVPPELARLIAAGLAEHAHDRPGSMAAFRDELQAFVDGRQPDAALVLGGRLSEAATVVAEQTGALLSIDAKAWETASQLRDMFRIVENTFYTANRHGWDHAETEMRVEGLLQNIASMLGDSAQGVHWSIRPYSFEFGGDAVWEPNPPHDEVTYNLFDAGFRELSLHPGIADVEIRKWLRWLYVDPERELAREDDMATAFWNLEFENARGKLLSAVLLQDLKDFQILDRELSEMQTDALNTLREGIQQRVQALGGVQSKRASRARKLQPDDFEITNRPPALGLPEAALAEVRLMLFDRDESGGSDYDDRLGETLVAALEDARRHSDSFRIIEQTRSYLADLRERGGWRRMLQLHAAISRQVGPEGVGRELTDLFRLSENVAFILRGVTADTDEQGRTPVRVTLEWLDRLLTEVDDGCFEAVLENLPRCSLPDVLEMMLRHLSRFAEGREEQIAAVIPEAFPALGIGLVRVLAVRPSRMALNALRAAYVNPAAHVRLEAMDVRARLVPQEVAEEVEPLLEDRDARVRARAHEIVRRAKLFSLGPKVAARVRSNGFHDLPLVDRHALMTTLFTIAREQAEAIAIDIVATHGFLENAPLDVSRKLAVELLAEHSASPKALEAIRDAGKSRWWNAKDLQEAAHRAVERIAARIASAGGG